jgi:predicted  nucleic acid-binding Zn-ribbon protein
MDSEALAITRIAADLQRKADRIAARAAHVEATLDKANADIEHRKVDLLRLQSEASSNESNACPQSDEMEQLLEDMKRANIADECEKMERAIMDAQRHAQHLREMLAALEQKHMSITFDLRAMEYRASDALQHARRTDDVTGTLSVEADHLLRARAQSIIDELERVRGDPELGQCEELR